MSDILKTLIGMGNTTDLFVGALYEHKTFSNYVLNNKNLDLNNYSKHTHLQINTNSGVTILPLRLPTIYNHIDWVRHWFLTNVLTNQWRNH